MQSDSFYGGVHDYLINLGYSDEPLHSITIRSLRGVYRLDSSARLWVRLSIITSRTWRR